MKKSRIAVLMLAAAMVLTLAACGQPAPSNSTDPGSTNSSAPGSDVTTYKIGRAFMAVDENTQRTLAAWQQATEEWNSSHDDIKIEFFYTDAQSNVETQLSNVETMLLEKPDVIILESIDTVGCIPAAEAIHNAGVFCVESRGMVSDAVDLSWTGFDEPAMSILSANVYREYLEKNPDAVLNAVLIYGNPAQANQLHRMDGFKALAEEYPDNINILDENYANWHTEEAQRLMEDWIQLYGTQINAVVSGSDAMALGAINALQAAGFKPGDVLMTAVDGTQDGLNQVASGWQTATVKMLMSSQARGQLDIIVKCLTGEYTEPTYNGGSLYTVNVTADLVEEYRYVD